MFSIKKFALNWKQRRFNKLVLSKGFSKRALADHLEIPREYISAYIRKPYKLPKYAKDKITEWVKKQ